MAKAFNALGTTEEVTVPADISNMATEAYVDGKVRYDIVDYNIYNLHASLPDGVTVWNGESEVDDEIEYDDSVSGFVLGSLLVEWDLDGVFRGTWESDVVFKNASGDVIEPPNVLLYWNLQDRAVQKLTLGAASTTLILPQLTSGKVSDFVLDVVNGYAPEGTPTAASFALAGTIGTDYNIIVPKGEDWSDMSALEPGEMAEYYFTRSAFELGGLPTWKIVKQTVEQYTPAAVVTP